MMDLGTTYEQMVRGRSKAIGRGVGISNRIAALSEMKKDLTSISEKMVSPSHLVRMHTLAISEKEQP